MLRIHIRVGTRKFREENQVETMTIIVHRSGDVIFSRRTNKTNVAALSIYLSIYVSISIYLFIYVYHMNVMNWYLDMPWVPMHALSTNWSIRYDPLPPWPSYPTYIHLFIHLCIYIYFFSFIYLSIFISIWKLFIYVSYLFINFLSIFIIIEK